MATQVLIIKPDPETGIECYFDADYSGEWNQDKGTDPGSILSRTGYIITYAKCLVIYMSKP